MSESIEKTQELLLAAKRKTDEARKELENTEAQIAEIDAIHLSVDVSFPKTTEVLNQIENNVGRINEHKATVKKLLDSMALVRKGIDDINALEKNFELFLKEIFFLDGNKRYEEALVRVDELEALANSVDFGEQLNVQRTLLEISAWTRCCLYDHMGDHNIREGVTPFTQEQLDDFTARLDTLPTRIHTPEQIEIFRDKIRGFRCVMRAKEALAAGHSYESLQQSLALIEEIAAFRASFSRFTLERFNYLKNVTTDEYNYLCVDAFDVRRVYEDAEALFDLRGYFDTDKILHDDFRKATDTRDFKIRFLKAEALRMDDEAFSIAVFAYADSIRTADEFEFEILAQYMTMENLSDTKVSFLLAAVTRMNIELLILFLAYALTLGIEVKRQSAILDGIYGKKEKAIYLDNCAKSLQTCIELLDESLQKRFGIFVKSMLRSPRAHKICVKSANPDLHVLYGEDREDFRRPVGKPFSKSQVKPWDIALKGLYYAFALILPLLLCGALFGFLFQFMPRTQYGPYLLGVPFVLIMLVMHLFICVRFGRDERGSAVFRRVVGIDSLLKAALCLVYFILPTTLSWLAPVGLGLFISTFIEGIWGFFLYKDNKKKIGLFIYVPLLLVLIAGVVFMILGMMNGQIG